MKQALGYVESVLKAVTDQYLYNLVYQVEPLDFAAGATGTILL